MAGSVNKAILVGHVGKDPVIKTFSSGDKVANFSIATSDSWRDKNTGERKEKTDWHNVAVFGNLAEVVEKYVRKGSKLYVEGKLQTRKWQDQSGQDKYTTEIVLQGFNASLVMLDGGGGNSRNDQSADPGDYGDPAPRKQNSYASARSGEKPFDKKIDDEIPF